MTKKQKAVKPMHTPGEWIACNGNVMLPTPDEKGEYKLIMQGPRGYNGKKFTVPEIDANARLIAAAPNLLAALKSAVFAWESSALSGDELPPYADKVRAAIAKAEGR